MPHRTPPDVPDTHRKESAPEHLALACVALSPLAGGATNLWVQLGTAILGACALGALLTLRGGSRLRTGAFSLGLLAICGMVGLQLVPLPAVLHEWASPAARDVFTSILQPLGGYPAWRPLSLDPSATARDLAKLLGWTSIFIVLQHRAAVTGRRSAVLRTIAMSGVLVASIGLVHLTLGLTSLFGVVSWKSAPSFVSTFGNPNHLGAMLAMCGLVAVGQSLAAETRQWLLWGGGALLCFAGTALTGSRGAMAGLGAGLLLFVPLVALAHKSSKNSPPMARVLTLFILVVGMTLAILTTRPDLRREVASLTDTSSLSQSKGVPVRAALRAVSESWVTGIGRGAFAASHTRWLQAPSSVSFTHVESEPVQAVAELGLFAGSAVLALFALAVYTVIRSGARSLAEAGAAAGAASVAVHDLFDFSMEYAVGLSFLCLLAVPLRKEAWRWPPRIGRTVPVATCLLILPAAYVAFPDLAADTRSLTLLEGTSRSFATIERSVEAVLRRRPADYLPCEVATAAALREKDGAARALPWANRTLLLHPYSARAHRLAAEALARLRHRDQALLELRTAASLGLPIVDEVLAWFGDDEAVLEAVPGGQASTLSAGWRLAALQRGALARRLVQREQGWPYNPALLELMSVASWQAGLHEEAFAVNERLRASGGSHEAWTREALWLRQAGDLDRARRLLIDAMKLFPAAPAIRFALAELELGVSGKGTEAALAALGPEPKDAEARARWHALRGWAYRAQGDLEAARAELRNAVRLDPEHVAHRVALAEIYLDLGRVLDAERELASVPAADARLLRERIARRKESARSLVETVREGALPRDE